MKTRTVVAAALLLGHGFMASAAGHPPTDAGPSLAEEVLFHGRVLNDVTGAALAGARVRVEGTAHTALSGATGEYRLLVPRAEISGGTARLVAELLGYARAESVVRITAADHRVDLRLTPAVLSLSAEVKADARGEAAAASMERAATGATRAMFQPQTAPGAPPMFPPHPGWNREQYAFIAENGFLDAGSNPLSTFSIDVDRASYSNVRRFILQGSLPPKDAVRIEEMVNYFPYDYPRPVGEHPFAIATEIAPAPWRPEHRLLRISLASPPIDTEDLPPANLVFLLDVSGSMQSPDKLPLVKHSLRQLVDELRPRDRVAIVVYAGAAGLVLPSTPGDQKTRILQAIDALEAGGSTAGGAGLQLAYDVARQNHIEGGNNRVILATDGDFNVGVSSDADMIRLVEQRRAEGTFLTVLGFGTGNLQDAKMEQMADHGNGNYAYIDSLLEARKVLVHELGGTLLTVARDVKLQVEFNPAVVRGYRLIGYENRLLAAADFNDDAKDAGELGAGHAVTALYEIVPVGVHSDVVIRGVDSLRYQTSPTRPPVATTNQVAFVRVRYKPPTGDRSLLLENPVPNRIERPSTDFRFASAVAGFGMLLRGSEHRGALTPDLVLSLARGALGEDPNGYRAEFVGLVEAYRSLAVAEE